MAKPSCPLGGPLPSLPCVVVDVRCALPCFPASSLRRCGRSLCFAVFARCLPCVVVDVRCAFPRVSARERRERQRECNTKQLTN
eukprot:338178-Amphidinium_carterae.1